MDDDFKEYLDAQAAKRAAAPAVEAETYSIPPHGWTCYFCGETFTTPGAAGDHFGAAPGQDPGCLIDYKVQLEMGGTPERGRGLQMALRKAEAEVERLQRLDEQHDNDLTNAVIALSSLKRKVGELFRPGRTVERLVELFHGTNADHGGHVFTCDKWPCTWMHGPHLYTRSLEPDVEEELKDLCIVCGRLEDDPIHVEAFVPQKD